NAINNTDDLEQLHELGVKLREEVARKELSKKKSKVVKAGSSDNAMVELQKKVSDLTNDKDNLDKELKQKQQQILNHKCDTPNSEELNQLKEDLKKANEEKEELERKLNEPIPSQEKEEDTKDLSIEELRTKLNEKNIVIGKLQARLDKMEKNGPDILSENKNNPGKSSGAVSELEAKVNEQQQEINKYKQLIANIEGLIKISNQGQNIDLFSMQKELTLPEQTDALLKRLEEGGLRLIVPNNGEYKAVIMKKTEYDDILKHNREAVEELIKRGQEIEKQPDNVVDAAKEKLKQEERDRQCQGCFEYFSKESLKEAKGNNYCSACYKYAKKEEKERADIKSMKKMTLEKRPCKVCLKDFIPKHRLKQICSPKCQRERDKYYKERIDAKKPKKKFSKAICIVCQKKFIKKKVQQNPFYRSQKMKESRERKKTPPPPKMCEICDRPIPPKRKLNAITCSQMVADSRRIILLPRNDKEKGLLEKAVAENKNWIEITDPKILKTFSAYNSSIKQDKCNSCQKDTAVMQLPIIKTTAGKQVAEEDKKMNNFCYNCIREMRLDLISREKINKVYTNKSQEAVSENSQQLMIEFLQKMEKFFEDFEKGEIRKCIFCEKDETEKIMASGEDYDYSAYYAKLEPNQGVCVDCFRLVKEERAKSSDIKSDKIRIAKIITEKAGKE
ncbi:12908_t:CDS:2, partial [Racocetra fulgida]